MLQIFSPGPYKDVKSRVLVQLSQYHFMALCVLLAFTASSNFGNALNVPNFFTKSVQRCTIKSPRTTITVLFYGTMCFPCLYRFLKLRQCLVLICNSAPTPSDTALKTITTLHRMYLDIEPTIAYNTIQ